MFIKLTRFDNRPIWLNAAFIVTVEPRKDGVGSVVVPIGDGFDYDVRESVAEILGKLDDVPAATVVPVPTPDCLTKTPVDVSPGPEPKRGEKRTEGCPEQKPDAASKPPEEKTVDEKPAEEKKPRKRTTRSRAKVEKSAVRKDPEPAVAEKAPLPLELSSDQVARLAKLAPKSVSKLKNTLATQFHVADVGATVLALEKNGTFSLDGTHVLWPLPPTVVDPQM